MQNSKPEVKQYFASGSLPCSTNSVLAPPPDLKPTSAMANRVVKIEDIDKMMMTKKSQEQPRFGNSSQRFSGDSKPELDVYLSTWTKQGINNIAGNVEPARNFKKARESEDRVSKEALSEVSIERAKTHCFYMFHESDTTNMNQSV